MNIGDIGYFFDGRHIRSAIIRSEYTSPLHEKCWKFYNIPIADSAFTWDPVIRQSRVFASKFETQVYKKLGLV